VVRIGAGKVAVLEGSGGDGGRPSGQAAVGLPVVVAVRGCGDIPGLLGVKSDVLIFFDLTGRAWRVGPPGRPGGQAGGPARGIVPGGLAETHRSRAARQRLSRQRRDRRPLEV
jgi:hypothetical protein